VSKEEEIKRLEEEIHNTPYNKATEHHIGKLKAKLARLKEEVKKSRAPKGHGFFVKKTGDASVAIIGPPSVGKSTLLNRLTNARSKVGEYSFTTTDIIPGMMDYGGCQIQILDLPGIIYGASFGKGRGKEIIAMARVVDMLLILVDVFTVGEIDFIQRELWNAGIRLNQKRPDVIVKKKDRGGIHVEFSKKCRMTEETAKAILLEYMSNADVVIRDDITDEELIDVITGNRVYLPALAVVNKIDCKTVEVKTDMDVMYISAEKGEGIEELKKKIFDTLELVRVYLKPEGKKVEKKPMVLKKGATVGDVCRKLHREFLENFRYAVIHGDSAAFPGQRVGISHQVKDGDIITIISR